MSRQPSCRGWVLRAFKNLVEAGPERYRVGKIAGSLAVFLLSASLASGATVIPSPTPPPPPRIAPIISGAYAGDSNGNRINDALDLNGGISIASDEIVEVELIFNAPVTPAQIDEFLRLGGQITYLYQAISFGWNGLISRQNIPLLPSALGPALVQVEASQKIQKYMDTATQVGRVRPVWKAGFAGVAGGLRGDPNTTIGFLGDGVDATHSDLRGRNVFWKDLSADAEPTPVDYNGHDTRVAGVAIGTGASGGADNRELRFTYTYSDPYYLTIGHETDPIALPASQFTMKTSAWWSPGQTCIIDQYRWTRGTSSTGLKEVGSYIRSTSPGVLTNTFTGSPTDIFASVLLDYDTKRPVENVTIVTTVNPYPGVGDGFNKFSGVAPDCKWAAVKIFDRDGDANSTSFTRGLDELVKVCGEKNIQIINISHGYVDPLLGAPAESTSLRDKVNTAVNNGIVVVTAAGNGANDGYELYRKMADPARAALAITVGASDDEDALTVYSTYGFIMPRANLGEDFKPDIIAPGGSYLYTGIMSVDSGSSDGLGLDKEPNDYASGVGTSFAAPFVSGCAALVIEAMEKQGLQWSFTSSDQPRYVKMLLCATANETNIKREGGQFNPTLSRAAAGPDGFPAGKDQQEGYGLLNADAAVEAVCMTYAAGATETATLGGNAAAKRVWARQIRLTAACDLDITLTNPAAADFDLYLYSLTPSDTGTPVILASSTQAVQGGQETLHYLPTTNTTALLVVKRVAGSGAFTLTSLQAGPPTAQDAAATCALNTATTLTLTAVDDGRPIPPGALRYTILSLPTHGTLELTDGTPLTSVPALLPQGVNKVVYRPAVDWTGEDNFSFDADDGGTPPFGGISNIATVKITVVREVTIECQIVNSADDASSMSSGAWSNLLTDETLYIGNYVSGMRFRNVKIPQGSTIKRATLTITASYGTSAIDGVLKGEATDNAAAFGTSSRIIAQLAATKASVPWKWSQSSVWTENRSYDSPDLSSVVQEIVDRPKWSSDNALVIIYGVNTPSTGDRMFWSYDGKPASAPRLVITFMPK